MKFILILVILLGAAATATYVRYNSFDPCIWMEQDLAEESGQPILVVRARIRAGFLLQGIVSPTAQDCLLEWWKLRRDGLPEAS